MDSCLQVKVSCVSSINDHIRVGQVCSAVCGAFIPLFVEDGIVLVEFNGMLSQVFVKEEYGKE